MKNLFVPITKYFIVRTKLNFIHTLTTRHKGLRGTTVWNAGKLNWVKIQIFIYLLRFEVFTAVTMKNAVFWDVAPCRSFVNRRFGGTWLQPPAHAGSSLTDFSTLKMEAIYSSETSVHTWSIQDLHGATSQTTAFFIYLFVWYFQLPLSAVSTTRYSHSVDSFKRWHEMSTFLLKIWKKAVQQHVIKYHFA
jgi:hypothetical protein